MPPVSVAWGEVDSLVDIHADLVESVPEDVAHTVQPLTALHGSTQRALNRALLARQSLLERSSLGIVDAVERIGGLQTQYAPSGYVGYGVGLAEALALVLAAPLTVLAVLAAHTWPGNVRELRLAVRRIVIEAGRLDDAIVARRVLVGLGAREEDVANALTQPSGESSLETPEEVDG